MNSVLFVIVYFLLPFCWWFFTARESERFLFWIGLKKITLHKYFVVIVVFTAAITYLSPKYFVPLFTPEGLTTQSSYTGMGLGAVQSILRFGLWTGFSEEFFFRGFLLKRLRAKFGFITAINMHSLIFALPHAIPLLLISSDLWFAALMFFFLSFLSAWLYGYISEKLAGGSIIPAILLHGLGNIVISLLHAFNLM